MSARHRARVLWGVVAMIAIPAIGGCASTADPSMSTSGLSTTGVSTTAGLPEPTLASPTIASPAVATSETGTAAAVQKASTTATTIPVAGASKATGIASGKTAAYTLTEEEKGLSCKKLTGRMQVRILQLRDWETQAKPSALAQTFQKTVSALWPGDTGTSISDERFVRDRAQLEAYNAELASKNCKTFNLDEELRPQAMSHTPEPTTAAAPPQ